MLVIQSIVAGVVAWVTWGILMEPGMVLHWWWQWLERLQAKGGEWVAKPLGLCGVCFAGQIGFWGYLVEYRGHWELAHHIAFICCTIFSFLITKQWAKKNELA